LPGLVCLLALGELLWRSGRLVVAFAVGHIGATLLVAAGLTSAVEFGWLPAAVSRATDVGMSYGAAAVLGTLTCALPRRWRAGWVGWWLAVGVTAVLMSREFTDVGHTVALVLGMVLSTRFGRPARWTRPLVLLLVIAAGFGYLMMAGSGLSLALAAGAGILGATAGHVLARRRMLAAAALVGGPPALG
jgi:hypothetical protein